MVTARHALGTDMTHSGSDFVLGKMTRVNEYLPRGTYLYS